VAWELNVKRLGLHQREGERARTYSAYQVVIDGTAVPALSGHICECTGPGDNTANGKRKHLRIHEGRYALSTQFGEHFRSVDFTDAPRYPMPGFRLLGTEVRSDVLVHPGYPPTLYLSSIGCLNPTNPLTADQDMDFEDSRARVIALIDSLKEYDPAAFADDKIGDNTPIADAFMVITGEPMTPAGDEVVASVRTRRRKRA
jgi:hypothetical protein